MQCAVVGVGEASVDEIDLVNIRQATHLAMARAVRALAIAPMFALVDGNDAPALPCPCDTIVDGDARSVSIAAASIIAKVTRDRMMIALHERTSRLWLAQPTRATAPRSTSRRSPASDPPPPPPQLRACPQHLVWWESCGLNYKSLIHQDS